MENFFEHFINRSSTGVQKTPYTKPCPCGSGGPSCFLFFSVMNIESLTRSVSRSLSLPPTKDIERDVTRAVDEATRYTNDVYEEVAVFCLRWEQDDTGSEADCKLFADTIAKLGNVKKRVIHNISSDDSDIDRESRLTNSVTASVLELDKSKRTLFIFYYAGHGEGNSNSLELSDLKNPKASLNFGIIKKYLMETARDIAFFDVLMVMDCCCSALGGRGAQTSGGRVEFVAATTETGTANAAVHGQTFTHAWCSAFSELLEHEERSIFTVTDVIDVVNKDREVAQFPKLFVLHEGSQLPIRFVKTSAAGQAVISPHLKSYVVLVALHLKESPGASPVEELTESLKKSVFPVTVIGAIQVDYTLLLVEMPMVLINFLPVHDFVPLCPVKKQLVVEGNQFVIKKIEAD